MADLRPMLPEDLPEVNLILSKAFTHARLEQGLREYRVPPCYVKFLEMYLAANPGGSFVIQKDGQIVAYCFSRLWGTVGWIGPLSVIPAEEGRGYGKEVVTAAVAYLKERGASTIGLEMPVHFIRNLAFYSKLGFIPGMPVVDLIRPLPQTRKKASETTLISTFFSETVRNNFLKNLRHFSHQVEPGLDYGKEIQLAAEFGFGDACCLSIGDETVGFILGHTETYSPEEERQFLKINALQMSRNLPIERLAEFLEVMEIWARSKELSTIYLRAPTRYYRGFQFLLSNHFRIVNTELRMTLKDYPQNDDPEQVNFSKWE